MENGFANHTNKRTQYDQMNGFEMYLKDFFHQS